MSSILLVHPETRTCEAVGSILEKSGHRVSSAQEGPRALETFRHERPEIVILNEELPKMACFQVFAEIMKIDAKTKVLVFEVQGINQKQEAQPKFGIRAFRPGEVLGIIDQLRNGVQAFIPQAERFAPRVLVVDDDIGVRDTVRRFLAEKGYVVAAAPNGLDALPLLKRLRPHLVLLDIDMPEMNGVETLKRIRELDGQAGVMMITGNDRLEMMERCSQYGAYDYLVKPLDFQYLEFSVYSKIVLMTF